MLKSEKKVNTLKVNQDEQLAMNISTQDVLYLDPVKSEQSDLKQNWMLWSQNFTNTKEEDEIQWTELDNVFGDPQPGI